MAPRGGVILGPTGQRLQKLADANKEAARKASEATKRRLSDQLYYTEEQELVNSKRRRAGKPKGAKHGTDTASERATFGSAEGYDRNGLTQRERDSIQAGDDPRRDGVGNLFEMEPQELGENDVRGVGKNGRRVEEHSEDDDDDPPVLESQKQPTEHRESIGGAGRNAGMGRSPMRIEQTSSHRSAGNMAATKSRSSGGALSGQGSGGVHQQIIVRPGKGLGFASSLHIRSTSTVWVRSA